ncbi:MAG: hypothetical protein U0531_01730 [Dehalococcoidia bacterium]
MRTEIYELDPFSAQKGASLVTLSTDYRFERNDELFISSGGKRAKVRVIHVHVERGRQPMRRVACAEAVAALPCAVAALPTAAAHRPPLSASCLPQGLD